MIALLRQIKITAFSYFWKHVRQIQAMTGWQAGKIPVVRLGHDQYHVFFGYYDICPFDETGTKVLANRLGKKSFSKSGTAPMSVGYYELDGTAGTFHEIGHTTTWCSQQGCRLQWYPGSDGAQILFNRIVDDDYGCVIHDTRTGKVISSFHRPVYHLSQDGKWGLSLNFSRLHRLRTGYGYSNFRDSTRGQSAPGDDGIWLMDMETGESRLLMSLSDVVRIDPLETMAGAEHYFNHLMFCPSGERFLFFHIWLRNQKRYTRLVTLSRQGSVPYALVNEGHVSHYDWLDDERIIAVATHSDEGFGYYVYRDRSRERFKIQNRELRYDGHPSLGEGENIVTDTYPDARGEQSLLVFSLESGRIKRVGAFYSPPNLKGTLRCDLHPRWDRSGTKICFDSAHEGNRTLYIVDVSSMLPL